MRVFRIILIVFLLGSIVGLFFVPAAYSTVNEIPQPTPNPTTMLHKKQELNLISIIRFSVSNFQEQQTNNKNNSLEDILGADKNNNTQINSEHKDDARESSTSNSYNYIGRFKIPDVKVNVALYDSYSQDVVDQKDSAAYFYGWKHMIIADHQHQGFDKIKKCTVGMVAEITENNIITQYKCVAIMQGYNTGKTLTDKNGALISEFYPEALVCYTCNENWKNITIVFFEKIGNKNNNTTNNVPSTPSNNETTTYSCTTNSHLWGEWELAWEVTNEDGSYYGWDKRFCNICDEESWQQRTTPSI